MALRQIICIRTVKNIQTSIYKKNFHCTPCLLEDYGKNVRDRLFVPLQKEPSKRVRKVSVVGGAGRAGTAVAYNLLVNNYCDEIVIYDKKEIKDKLCGEALDMLHGTPIRKSPKIKICMDMENTKDSDFIFISAGIPHEKGKTRLDVAQDNVDHFKTFVKPLAKLSPDSVILVASNPVDIMTYAAWKYSGFEKNRVIGTGCELDSARFRYHIGKRLGVNPKSVGAWVIGEHGDSSVPAWSCVDVAGCRLRDIDPKIGECDDENQWDELHKQVVKDGPMVMGLKGWTNWAISVTAQNIMRAVLNDSHTVHCVSTQITGIHGVCTECFLSFPCVLGSRGVHSIVKQCLCPEEIEKLQSSATVLDKKVQTLKF